MSVAFSFLQVSLEVQAKLFYFGFTLTPVTREQTLELRAREAWVRRCFSRRAPCKNDFEDKKTRQIVLQSIETKLYGLFLSLLFPDPSPSGSSYQPAHSQNCYYTCDLKATCVCDALFGTHRCWCLDGYVGSGHTGKCRSKFTTNSMNKN